jgi:hypothetical protein
VAIPFVTLATATIARHRGRRDGDRAASPPAPLSSLQRTALRDIVQGAVLLPRGVAAASAALIGRTEMAGRRLRAGTCPPGNGRVLLGPLWSVLLGAVVALAVGLEVLFVAWGVLYGLVDPGPYNNSWGGPSRVGAWLAHARATGLLATPPHLAAPQHPLRPAAQGGFHGRPVQAPATPGATAR